MVTIGFSRATGEDSYQLYINWLKSIDSSFDFINFYGMEDAEILVQLEKCSGLVLTGGPDVHPSHFGKTNDEHRCTIDLHRDNIEFLLIKKALILKLPILAICRGEQILCVAKGGNLIVDISSDFGNSILHKSTNEQTISHNINIELSSNLYEFIKQKSFDVVSSHHQAVKILPACFCATAFANDGIIEAYEWTDKKENGYLNAVQWHPEKGNYNNALSYAIGKNFINAVYLFKLTNKALTNSQTF